MKIYTLAFLFLSATLFLVSCGQKWTETQEGEIMIVQNQGGKTLGYSTTSGVSILTIDRFGFKDLNKNGTLEKYEDWRLPVDERAEDLASRMSIEEIAGLMLYSGHQSIPGGGYGGRSTYDGKPFRESDATPSDLTDQQIDFLSEDNLRHVLITSVESPEVAAKWNNNVQALVEGLAHGIPANNSSDPRHRTVAEEEYNAGAGGDISRWPGSIGLAAGFEPELVREFGRIASMEYRALGIATALSPQVDLATDPRWYRFSGTFGESPQLAAELGKAYIDGFQTSSPEKEIANGWGFESVNAMAKHWPGGGTGEGGRDAHYGFGKYGVYPGNNLETHLIPFLEGAFALQGGTQMASAIMPYYTISYGQDPGGDNVGNAFSKYFITDLLREKYSFDGVVCTDWGVTRDDTGMANFGRTPWGVEHLSVAERHFRILLAGCDQFGGNNDAGPVIEAYQMGVKEFGEEAMRERFEQSAVRLLRNIFQVGLFENPYLNVQETVQTVGNSEFMKAGYEAQLKSVIMLKNTSNVLPLKKEQTIYIPQRYRPASPGFFGPPTPAGWIDPLNLEIVKNYFKVTNDPQKADVAVVVINNPEGGRTAGYSEEDAKQGETGFLPISLQYGDYTADNARDPSIAGDPRENDVLNRTYKGKTVSTNNASDLKLIMDTRAAMQDKPVIVLLRMDNPTVVAEFEKETDGLLINFGVQDQALLDIISGKVEPSGLLPFQMPADMNTVEAQHEDVPFDMEVYIDTDGNTYGFGFGLNWSGVIEDERTGKFRKSI